jgi:hypothetical protein
MQSFRFHRSGAQLRTFAIALSLLSVQTAFAIDFSGLWPIAAAGSIVKEARSLGFFRSLKLSTDARVVVHQGERESVVVEAESNIAPLIDTYVEDGTLVVEDGKHFESSNAQVVITVRRIANIGTTGSVAVVAEGLHAHTLSLSMGGSSAISLKDATLGKLRAALGGSSALVVTGTAEDLSAELGGSSTLQAAELMARSVSVSGGGSAQAAVWSTESLRISLSGSSGVSYFGDATGPAIATSGSATVKHLGVSPPKKQ